jgi:type IV secretory pathway VirB2 component (pilin)
MVQLRIRTRVTQVVLILLFLALGAVPARSGGFGGLGGGMPWEGPWEGPLNQLLDSLTGPVSRVVGAVAIIGRSGICRRDRAIGDG